MKYRPCGLAFKLPQTGHGTCEELQASRIMPPVANAIVSMIPGTKAKGKTAEPSTTAAAGERNVNTTVGISHPEVLRSISAIFDSINLTLNSVA
jgi:hypothetical protein